MRQVAWLALPGTTELNASSLWLPAEAVWAQAGPAPQPLPCKRESDLVVLVEEEEE